jgi:uncharacterized damage-inducible protein DinB
LPHLNTKQIIVIQLEQAFRRRSWHGTNLLGSIRGIDPETAALRPGPGRHNIWETIVHCAYWKYSVYRRLAGEPKPKFALSGSNWLARPVDQSAAALRSDIALLKDYHSLLLGAFSGFAAEDLEKIPQGSSTSFVDLVIGVAAHDLYHAGQIQIIKRLVARPPGAS